jgi:hypothetical protein
MEQAEAKQQQQQAEQSVYTLNWVIINGEGELVLTNSDLPVVQQCKGIGKFPCHDSHMPVLCSAQMVGTRTYGREQFSLRLTSEMFDGKFDILFKFDPSFLDMFIGGATKVLFPMPIEKPIKCGMIMSDDMKGKIVLTNESLPVVQMKVIVADIQNSKTPDFDETENGVQRRCALPTGCLSVMPCHNGHVPVLCSGKIGWFQTFGSKTSVILLLFSTWLETPIYIELNTDISFLDQFIHGEIQLFFPIPIRKSWHNAEIKDSSNHISLKGLSGREKKKIRNEMEERVSRGKIGYDDDDPIPVKCYREIQRPNQIWSIISNNWELVGKPMPRLADWKWDDSTATWVCELDTKNKKYGLKLFDRSTLSNCFGVPGH